MINFHYPNAFYFLFGFALVVVVLLWSRWQRKRDLLKLGDWRVIQKLIPVEALVRRKKKDLIGLIGLFILIFAAAGPQFGSRLKEVKHRGVDVFIAMDTSRSMLAEDVPPSRLSRAKRSLSLLIKKLDGNRVGIIAFAKFAVLQCPLTVDNDAARMFLDILDETTVPQQGTSLGDAIRLALKGFSKDEKEGKALVLLTDGEDHESDPLGAAEEAKEQGVRIFTIGIGTTKGEVLKKRDDRGKVVEFHKHKGELVLSRLDDALLSQISKITGGKYYRASSTDKEIDEISDILQGLDKKEFAAKIYERLQERYQIFALIALLLLLLEFFMSEKPGQSQRIKAGLQMDLKKLLPLFLIFCFITPAFASVKDHVLKGNKYLKQGKLEEARGEFESARIDAPEAAFLPYNIAATYYLEGEFDEAKNYYEQAYALAKSQDLRSKIRYNEGHLLFNSGDKKGAIEKFKESLILNPNDADAKYNIEYIRAGLTPKQPFKPQPQKQDKGDKGDQDEKDKQDGENQQGEGEQDKKQDGDLSKEDAERILQMIQDEESDKLKDAKPLGVGQGEDDKEKNQNFQDW